MFPRSLGYPKCPVNYRLTNIVITTCDRHKVTGQMALRTTVTGTLTMAITVKTTSGGIINNASRLIFNAPSGCLANGWVAPR